MKEKKADFKIVHSDGSIIFQGSIMELPLKEEYILFKSFELFHEKEPCIIYRTHIMKKFYLELYDYLNHSDGNMVPCSELVDFLREVDLEIKLSTTYFDRE